MPFLTLPARVLRDLRALPASPTALALAALWVVGSGSLVAFFPREKVSASAEATAEAPAASAAETTQTAARAVAPKTLAGSERAEFDRWYAAQPTTPIAVPSNGATVVIVKFNDYQCPPCRQTFMNYKPILEKFKTSHPGKVTLVTKDFPLDPECNAGGAHQAACEAAAAVRMARVKGKAEALEDWLFDNQPAMTPDLVRQGVRQVAGVTDFNAQYPGVLEQVRADIQYGRTLGVGRTPTFFINGRKIEGGLEPHFFEAAIDYELSHAKDAKQ